MQALFPRQATHSQGIGQAFIPQAGSPKPLPSLPGRSAGSADTLPQADWSLHPSKGAPGTTVGDAASSPDNKVLLGNKGRDLEAGALAPSAQDKPKLYLLGVPLPVRGKHHPSHKWVIN